MLSPNQQDAAPAPLRAVAAHLAGRTTSLASCSGPTEPEPPRGQGWAARDRAAFAELGDDGHPRGGQQRELLPSPFEPEPPRLLSDDALWHWCAEGYHVITPEELGLPAQLHAGIYDKLKFVLHEEHQPGNNILARVPELGYILSSPAVTGALQTLLGPDHLQ